ncbi:MAG: hypothetical protein WCE23_11975 [Candidatus Binatus sp.]|uniref:hypothetical protein n=1 Tax=Candidatus Binatus sp. TaxID=2811406 RepID=UPI003C77DB43
MKLFRIGRFFSTAATIAMLISRPAFAAQPRPWLCRDKPVFSSDRAMEYQVTARPGRDWRIFFMQYSPDAAHDGFDIVNSRVLSSRGDPAAGSLAAGRYFAVALYRGSGGHWICPGYTHDDRDSKLGELSNLCYGEDGPPCLVKLQVKPDHHLTHPPTP